MPIGPSRETLISGLLTLNGLGLASQSDLQNVLVAKPHHLALWQQVQDGFSQFQPIIGESVLKGTKALIADNYPITEIVLRALEWFDLGAIDEDLMQKVSRLPLLFSDDERGFDLCHSFAGTVKALSENISMYLNDRFACKNTAPNNSIEKRSQYAAAEGGNLHQCLQLYMPDFVVFQNGFSRTEVRECYWNTFLRGITHIQCFLMPMMTVDDLLDVVEMFEEDRFYEIELVEKALKANGVEGLATDDEINQVFEQSEDGFCFMQEAADYRATVDEQQEFNKVREAWSPLELSGFKDAHNFGRQIRTLPEPENKIEANLKSWLIDLNKLLPKKKHQSTPLRDIYDRSEVEGVPFENMYLIEREDNHLVDEHLQQIFQGYMETGEDNIYALDWSFPAETVIKTLENFRQMARLFDRLECLNESETLIDQAR